MIQFISPSLIILSAIADGDKHGYSIMQWATEKTGSSLPLGPATLYTTLRKLEQQKLIIEIVSDDPRRRVYSCTHQGHLTLAQQLSLVSSLASAA